MIELKNFADLKDHIGYLNYLHLRKQGIRVKMKKEKEYQKRYFEEILKERKN